MKDKSYICIDLKSFYASVECVERGLDPFKSNLVVADPDRGSGTICLAVSPAMKALGVPGRCRIFQIPKNIEYTVAKPRMRLYIEKSSEIYRIYLRYISSDDIYIYSVDECFIDVTGYLKTYKKTPAEIAKMLMKAVYDQTGICAAAGIGTNLFLAKVALDITAKHSPDHIGILDQESFKRTIWYHRPISDIWNIGPGTAKTLSKYGVYDLHGVTSLPDKTLYHAFGANARYLIDHANGIERCTIEQIKSYVPRSHSLSNSQILMEDYGYEDALVVMREMVDIMSLDLVRKKLVCGSISLCIGYSKDCIPPSGKSMKLGELTSSYKILSDLFDGMYKTTANREAPIRKLSIGMGGLVCEWQKPITFFTDNNAEEKERSLMRSIVSLQERYGKNAILRGRDYTKPATLIERNYMIGGHNGI